MTTTEIRIEGMLKNIEKSQATLARHQARLEKKAQECKKLGIDNPNTWDRYTEGRTNEQYWAKCNYDSVKSDIKATEKKIKEFQERLQFWRNKKKSEDEKNDVPMIPAVEEFLARWKKAAESYYRQQVAEMSDWCKEYKEYYDKTMKELESEFGYAIHCYDKKVEAAKVEKKVDWKYKDKYIKSHWTQVVVMLYSANNLDSALEKLLTEEVNNKRVDLYHRCSAVVGVITDATGLRTGGNGSINGIVVGENGKASVETIMAGGWNIQCLHYRVLVTPIKETPKTEKQPKIAKKVSVDKNLNYTEKTLEELKQMAKANRISYKEYSDERITRMRLVMALKKNR